MRLGRGEPLDTIVQSSSQVAEGVATAEALVAVARRNRVSLPVLTAVARIVQQVRIISVSFPSHFDARQSFVMLIYVHLHAAWARRSCPRRLDSTRTQELTPREAVDQLMKLPQIQET